MMRTIHRRTAILSLAAAGAAGAIFSPAKAAAGGMPAITTADAGQIKMAQNERRAVTADNPYVISNPSLAFANLLDDAGKTLIERDRAALADVFPNNIQVAERTIPKCNVLFLYCALDASGRVAGPSVSFRDLIKAAGAHVAVLAAEIQPALLQNPEFVKGLTSRNDWPANIVITMNRNGEHFGRFFHKLFSQMKAGVTMPMAWVELAPQGPQQPADIPGTICLMEAGHIAFGSKKS